MSLSSETEGLAIFEKNLNALFAFKPELAALLSIGDKASAFRLLDAMPCEYSASRTREGQPLLAVRGFSLHSRYNPEREARRAIGNPAAALSPDACVFAGLGLGYYCLEYAKKCPRALLAIVEPDVNIFLLCMKLVDIAPLLASSKAIFLVGLSPSDCAAAIDGLQERSALELPVFSPPALAKANAEWFASFHEELRKRKEKREINLNTLRRFGGLWLKNIARNRAEMKARQGIARFRGAFAGMPALLLAAGPSLDGALASLKDLREKCVVISVDTALRACLRAGVQPDFLVLVDPQYWNYRHAAGLSSPGTILITEAGAYPAVFRLKFRDIFLCSSLFPVARFIEERSEKKGELGAGGSVATTAWDFARYIGAVRIYAAGLDLAYPQKKTHFRGALFEELAHASSTRLCTAEGASAAALFSAGPFWTESASGGAVLTDKRLSLYAWWLESAFASAQARTELLSPEGARIRGAGLATAVEIMALPSRRRQIDSLLNRIELEAASEREGEKGKMAARAFERAEGELDGALRDILALAEKGIALCEGMAKGANAGAAYLAGLEGIDRAIAAHPARDVLAAAFAESRAARDIKEENAGAALPEMSLRIYRRIAEAARATLAALGAEGDWA